MSDNGIKQTIAANNRAREALAVARAYLEPDNRPTGDEHIIRAFRVLERELDACAGGMLLAALRGEYADGDCNGCDLP